MRVLVAVASKHGSTREIAEAIAEELHDKSIWAVLQDASEVKEIISYDAVILGSAIYAGNWLPEAKHFAARFQLELANVPVWLFSSGPLGADNPKPNDDPQKLAAPLGNVKVRDHRVFVGKLELDNLGVGDRLIAKVFKAPTGDFRDWEEIRGWAREIAAELRATNSVPHR
jgi:menaquinone-dependent protoporphyrinogen oxidase